jgi:hypothetical protein
MNKSDFYEVLGQFTKLPGEIPVVQGDIKSLLKEDFSNVLHSSEAKNVKNIVYVWRTKEKFPRFNGESNILYIGQTKRTFAQRYQDFTKWINTEANFLKFHHALKNYGPITISVCEYEKFGESLLKSEGQLLWWYFQNHYEYPPLNYTKTKIRTSNYP